MVDVLWRMEGAELSGAMWNTLGRSSERQMPRELLITWCRHFFLTLQEGVCFSLKVWTRPSGSVRFWCKMWKKRSYKLTRWKVCKSLSCETITIHDAAISLLRMLRFNWQHSIICLLFIECTTLYNMAFDCFLAVATFCECTNGLTVLLRAGCRALINTHATVCCMLGTNNPLIWKCTHLPCRLTLTCSRKHKQMQLKGGKEKAKDITRHTHRI